VLAGVPIAGILGDQHAALFGQVQTPLTRAARLLLIFKSGQRVRSHARLIILCLFLKLFRRTVVLV